MREEIDSLHNNHTHDLVELPKDMKALKNRWFFKVKNKGNGQVNYKGRKVVKDLARNTVLTMMKFSLLL